MDSFRPLKLHIFFSKGAYYVDATFNISKFEDGVPKGQTVTLTWKLDADFAPRDDDDNCIPFAYHSHKNPDQEVNAGLLGLLVICKQGKTKTICEMVTFENCLLLSCCLFSSPFSIQTSTETRIGFEKPFFLAILTQDYSLSYSDLQEPTSNG